MIPEIIHHSILDVQVCVPKGYTDEEVEQFVNGKLSAGMAQCSLRWRIRKQGDRMLAGEPERQQCLKHPENCHIMLDC